jgi:hypothetical protein
VKWVLAVSGLVLLTACGGGEAAVQIRPSTTAAPALAHGPTTSPVAAPVDGAVCAALADVKALDARTSQLTNDLVADVVASIGQDDDDEILGQLRSWGAQLQALAEQASRGYRRAAAAAPPDVAGAIEELGAASARYMERFAAVLAEAPTLEQFFERYDELFSEPEVSEAIATAAGAALTLDGYTEPNCGFRLSR